MLSHFSHVWLFETPWTVARQAPLSNTVLNDAVCSYLILLTAHEGGTIITHFVQKKMFPSLPGVRFTWKTCDKGPQPRFGNTDTVRLWGGLRTCVLEIAPVTIFPIQTTWEILKNQRLMKGKKPTQGHAANSLVMLQPSASIQITCPILTGMFSVVTTFIQFGKSRILPYSHPPLDPPGIISGTGKLLLACLPRPPPDVTDRCVLLCAGL